MGRQEEPTQEELEFIFGCMARGLSPSEILDEMQDTEFPLRGREFISRKRKYFDAAKKVLQTHVESKEDLLLEKAREQHFSDLINIGQELISWLGEYKLILLHSNHEKDAKKLIKEIRLVYPKHTKIVNHPLFECLKLHIPDSEFWSCFYELDNFRRLTGHMLLKKDKSLYLEKMKKIVQEAEKEAGCEEEGYWDSLPDDEICMEFMEYYYGIVGLLHYHLSLYIGQRVFPGTCPACPIDYRSE